MTHLFYFFLIQSGWKPCQNAILNYISNYGKEDYKLEFSALE